MEQFFEYQAGALPNSHKDLTLNTMTALPSLSEEKRINLIEKNKILQCNQFYNACHEFINNMDQENIDISKHIKMSTLSYSIYHPSNPIHTLLSTNLKLKIEDYHSHICKTYHPVAPTDARIQEYLNTINDFLTRMNYIELSDQIRNNLLQLNFEMVRKIYASAIINPKPIFDYKSRLYSIIDLRKKNSEYYDVYSADDLCKQVEKELKSAIPSYTPTLVDLMHRLEIPIPRDLANAPFVNKDIDGFISFVKTKEQNAKTILSIIKNLEAKQQEFQEVLESKTSPITKLGIENACNALMDEFKKLPSSRALYHNNGVEYYSRAQQQAIIKYYNFAAKINKISTGIYKTKDELNKLFKSFEEKNLSI